MSVRGLFPERGKVVDPMGQVGHKAFAAPDLWSKGGELALVEN
jgi:hypothetical protein